MREIESKEEERNFDIKELVCLRMEQKSSIYGIQKREKDWINL